MVADTLIATHTCWNVCVNVTDSGADIDGTVFQSRKDCMDGSGLNDGNKNLARGTEQTLETCGANRKQRKTLFGSFALSGEEDRQCTGTGVHKWVDVRFRAEMTAFATKTKVELTPGEMTKVFGGSVQAEAAANEMTERGLERGRVGEKGIPGLAYEGDAAKIGITELIEN